MELSALKQRMLFSSIDYLFTYAATCVTSTITAIFSTQAFRSESSGRLKQQLPPFFQNHSRQLILQKKPTAESRLRAINKLEHGGRSIDITSRPRQGGCNLGFWWGQGGQEFFGLHLEWSRML